MELSPTPSPSRPCPALSPEGESLFDKYKLGLAHLKAPFRLFDTSCSTCCEEESESDSHPDRKARGPYRKYTFEEKMQAVQRVSPSLCRYKMDRTSRSSPGSSASPAGTC